MGKSGGSEWVAGQDPGLNETSESPREWWLNVCRKGAG